MSVCVYCVHIPNFCHILNFELKSYVCTHVDITRIQLSLPGTKGEWQHLNPSREWGNPGLSNSFL